MGSGMSCLAVSRTAQIGLSELLRMLTVLNGIARGPGLWHVSPLAVSVEYGASAARNVIVATIMADRFVMFCVLHGLVVRSYSRGRGPSASGSAGSVKDQVRLPPGSGSVGYCRSR